MPHSAPPGCKPRRLPILPTALNLVFHALVDERDSGSIPPGWMEAAQFGDRLEGLLSSGLKPVELSHYLDAGPPAPGSFTLSFDDAHVSVLHLARPILRELRVPATLFVPTGYIAEADWAMSWDELQALSREPGWAIGSHGASHVLASWRLYAEDQESQSDRLRQDARKARQILTERLGIQPLLYAYPFGQAPACARDAVREAGYRAAFTVDPSLEFSGDLFAIPRRDGTGGDPDTDVQPGISVIVPAFNRVPLLREVLRRLDEQTYPQDRYEVIVVDDGSSEDLSAALPSSCRLLRPAGTDSGFRAGQARQAGAEAAGFEVLAFLDADVAVDRDFLWHLAWCHRQDPQAVVLGYLSGYNLHDLGHQHRLADIREADRLTGDTVPVIPDRSREPVLRSCLDNLAALENPWTQCYTGNLSVSHELLDQAGGFATEFTGWGLEDIDLGIRLTQAGGRFCFSRFALGYHLSDPEEEAGLPSNPFRHPYPSAEAFRDLARNLEVLSSLHPHQEAVQAFCGRMRLDIAEHLDPPSVLGVECGAGYPFDWPFGRLHRPKPGGTPLEEILDRLAYAHKLQVQELYLLGGDLALRDDLLVVLEAARDTGAERISIETTAMTISHRKASDLKRQGLTDVMVEICAGRGHPRPEHAAHTAEGIRALNSAGIRTGAKLVLGADDPDAFGSCLSFLAGLELSLYTVVVLPPAKAGWVSKTVGKHVELVQAGS